MSRSLRSSGRILCPFMRIWTSCPSASIASTCSKKRRLVSSISGGCLGRRHRKLCGRRDGLPRHRAGIRGGRRGLAPRFGIRGGRWRLPAARRVRTTAGTKAAAPRWLRWDAGGGCGSAVPAKAARCPLSDCSRCGNTGFCRSTATRRRERLAGRESCLPRERLPLRQPLPGRSG